MPAISPRTWGQFATGSRGFKMLKGGVPGGVEDLLETLPGWIGSLLALNTVPKAVGGIAGGIRNQFGRTREALGGPTYQSQEEQLAQLMTPSVGEQYIMAKAQKQSQSQALQRYLRDPMYRATVDATLKQRSRAGDQQLEAMQQSLAVPGEYRF